LAELRGVNVQVTRISGRLRAAGLGVSLAGAVAAAIALLSPAAADAATSMAIAADRQNYAPQPNGAPDQWSANSTAFGGSTGTPDQVDMHVGATPQAVTYISYVHLEVDAIPQSDTVSSLVLTVHPTDDQVRQEENTNSGTTVCANATSCTTQQNFAVLDAFPLKDAYPADFNQASPPAYDPKGPEAVGKFNDKDASWSFDLAPMITYWQQHGNTGLALVPDAAATQAPWSIGFYMAATTSKAELSGAGSGTTLTSSSAPVSVTFSGSSGVPGVSLAPNIAQGLPAASQPAKPAAPAQGGAARAGGGAALPPATPSGMVPLWLLVLAVSTTGVVALLAQPVSQALAAAGGFGPAVLSQLRLHPRMFGVAAVLLVWSSTFGVYANTLGRPLLSSNGYAAGGPGAQNGTAGSTQSGGTAGSATGSGPAAASNGSGTAAGTTGSSASAGGAFANSPNPPSANLFAPNQETVGLTASQIFLCAHAALTFGPAFNIGASDLNVFWDMVNDQGGVWGRKIVYYDSNGNLQSGINITDDGYQPSKAVVAAQQCQDEQGGDFFLMSGIGFDQIPAVRVWAEQHHVLYIHHIVLQSGSDGLRYSFTMLPALEEVGKQYGQYYVNHFAGKKIGIIERNSSNWEAGSTAFKDTLKAAGYGGDIVADDYVQNNQGQYAQEIADMSNPAHKADIVLIWENALAAEQIVNQANQQGFDPTWIEFPFNLTLQTLAQSGVPTSELTKMYGMVPWPAYTCYASQLPQYSSYAQELRQFEAAYAKYDPGAKLCSVGGDLLFGTWEAWRQVYDLLSQCGRFCTRDKVAGLMLSGYHATVGANCPVDFRGGDGHHGGYDEDLYHVVANITTSGPAGSYNGPAWVNDQPFCQRNIS
jgi:hypothetical protein